MKLTLAIFLSFISVGAWAAGGEAHGDIPWAVIGQQAFNLSLVIVGFTVLLRKKVAEHFKKRRSQFAQLVERAEQAKVAAEKNKREITERLQKLESTADDGLKNAKGEAEDLKRKILLEAQTLSARLEEEAKRTADFEVERVKQQLRKALLDEAVKSAKANLTQQMNPSEQKRLQTEFVGKIQVVQ